MNKGKCESTRISNKDKHFNLSTNKAAKSKTLLVANVKVANVVVQAVPPGTDRLYVGVLDALTLACSSIVSDNPLGTVDASTVLPSSLIDLDLSKCSLTRIDRAFRYPERLRKLDLSDNNMTSFVPDLLPISLSELKLAGNPLDDFVIRDRAMLKQLRQMKTLDATTTNVMCNSTAYRKIVVQGQVFACMLKAMAESTTMLNANGNMAGTGV
ncbi:hypothetical protein DYB32_004550 [Aphanomyces invadans]|uniref:Uncharacterized protein n=1 Tax=Aphanomyces invadans TaxID=157072 RepID=A0A418AX87_9STRA|nr:hypothetical protein DYB32_004550 [Aphanomyces invadans]